ncbi:hypothetical protein B0T24DRAFT_642958 [Lasiosphaeria ovina]|uniref:Uncharacterized protein n=1 Tax=Lasiosphaeria ovina TaxID=92902 RepID=A0AAE0JT00_9PEZI|nr:hypothetical protein B0T24DRAFT_642958 [Lasiosphaeria ovina]
MRHSKRRVADNVINLALRLESPLALIGIAKSRRNSLATDNRDGLAGGVGDLAAQRRIDEGPEAELDGLERAVRANRRLLLASARVGKHGLRPELGGLVGQHDADLCGGGAERLEAVVAHDGADEARRAERPGALAGVAECDVHGRAAHAYDWLALVVEDLAAQRLVGDAGADGDLDCLEGPALCRPAGHVWCFVEDGLRARLGQVAEDHAHLLIGGGAALRRGHGARGGEGAEEEGGVLHCSGGM